MTVTRTRWRLLLALFAGVLVLASCAAEEDPETTTGDPATPADPAAPLSLGDGVSSDTIDIGVAILDFQALVDAGLSPNGWGDQELAMETFIADLNDRGGINGRMVNAIYEFYNPVSTEEAEAACLRLTEDNTVFAVVGGFLGPAEPANTCIAGRQETVLIGGTQSPERLAEAKATWIQERATRERQTEVLFDLLDADGRLDGKRIAIVTGSQAEDQQGIVTDKLAQLDIEPVAELFNDAPSGDIVAEDAAWATIAEKIRDVEADVVVLVGNTSSGVRNNDLQGLDVEIWAVDQEQVSNLGSSVDPETARGVISAAGLTGQDAWDDETMAECREIYAAANPDIEVKDPDDLEEGDEEVATGISVQCRNLKLFELVATQAGENLNNDTFATAVAEIGKFSLPGQPFASLGPDKFDTNNTFRLVEFDPDVGQDGQLVPLGELQDIS